MPHPQAHSKRSVAAVVVFAAFSAAPTARAGMVSFHGRVVMEDGSPPGRLVGMQRTCEGSPGPVHEANASAKTGEYFVRLYIDPFGAGFGRPQSNVILSCYLEAVLPGFTSTRLDLNDTRLTRNPQLPNIVLSRERAGAIAAQDAPRSARKPWGIAAKRLAARDWAGAEAALRSVVAAAPAFAPAWAALGAACQGLNKPAEARRALERAIALDPKRLPLYVSLAAVQIQLKDWPAAARTSEALIQADSGRVYLEAYLQNAVALYQQRAFEGAAKRMNELMRLDKRQELPRAEYVLALMLESQGRLDAAAQHMRQYLAQHPRAADAAEVKARLASLGRRPAVDLAAELSGTDLRVATTGEARVPGGIRAFAALARIPGTPTYQDFFLQYCRAIIGEGLEQSTPAREVSEAVRAFAASVAELEPLGERSGSGAVIRLATHTPEARLKTERALRLLGWRLRQNGDRYEAEPGDRPIDGLLQRIPAAFGIDELEMRDAILGGRPFEFEIPIESARLVGGSAWSTTLKGMPGTAPEPVDLFRHDWRFTRAYAALGAMEPETAAAVVAAVGFVPLIGTYSERLAEYGDALSLARDRVAAPGGTQAEAAWTRLAGAAPADPPTFFRALLEKDRGLLLAFYFDVARADAAHQRFLTTPPARAEAFYNWYRQSAGQGPPARNRWQAAVLQKLRLDANGALQLPGGRAAWSSEPGGDEAVLLRVASLEPVAALAGLEEKRGRPLDTGSARLLARHYREWRHLFPYFEQLPELSEREFRSLASFADAAAAEPAAEQETLLGIWHSLVQLVILGRQAGSLEGARAAREFGRICDTLRAGNAPVNAIEALGEIAGASADGDEALAANLLRLSGLRRERFERIRELQRVPRISSLGRAPDAARTLSALSGAVYAALLDPRYLLVAEDPRLLGKHEFVPQRKETELFADSGLVISNSGEGSKLTGGFGRFREVTRALEDHTVKETADESASAEPAAESSGPYALSGSTATIPLPAGPVFRAKGRIVEVYATVTDHRGRYVDNLGGNDFSIQVEGWPMPIFAFENQTANVSVALLLDTTGSMTATLPSLKRAALQLIDELRPADSAAAYGFSDKVTEFQGFTTDKTALKRAVLRAHPAGRTALYDALVRVTRDLAGRHGKKVIIVFTDGADNASMLTADIAILRAKSRGIPIYTVAEGEALRHPHLVSRLTELAGGTGGSPFLIRKLEDIGAAFQRMSQDLVHGYLLAFQAPPFAGGAWHKIAVSTANRKGLLIRARGGYFSE